MRHQQSILYFKFIEDIYMEIEKVVATEINKGQRRGFHKSLILAVKYHQSQFWDKHYKTVLSSSTVQSRAAPYILWGRPYRFEGDQFHWDPNNTMSKLLCYSGHVVIPDWLDDELRETNYMKEESWIRVFNRMLITMKRMIELKPFVDRGVVSVFPPYNCCWNFWPDEYGEILERTQQYAKTMSIIEGMTKSYRYSVSQEMFVVQSKLGYVPVTSDPEVFEQGLARLKEKKTGTIIKWEEQYKYIDKVALETIDEIRRWNNQTTFLEALPEIAERFDLSCPDQHVRDEIATYLSQKKRNFMVKQKKKDIIHKFADLLLGIASIAVAPLSLVSIGKSALGLFSSRRKKTGTPDDLEPGPAIVKI